MIRFYILVFSILVGCREAPKRAVPESTTADQYLIVLGNVQDAGSPHAGCQKSCCAGLFETPDPFRLVTSLGLVDRSASKTWLFEASPDLPIQMKNLTKETGSDRETPDGIFLTHAHIGHYAGLMFLGKESMNASKVPVYSMPRMLNYLSENGPWEQLVNIGNIDLTQMKNDSAFKISETLSIRPLLVPHRDEYSETVGYKIIGPNKSALFIPDIDKWTKWERSIVEEVRKVDYAFLDATFFDDKEVARDISEIPHPFVIESMTQFEKLTTEEKSRVYFIHFNHTNPLLDPESEETRQVLEGGFQIARYGMRLGL